MRVTLTKKIMSDERNPLRRTRAVDIHHCAMITLRRTIERGKLVVNAYDGGSVPNAYGYAAVTDGVVAIGLLQEGVARVAIWANQLSANKVTLRGVGQLWGLGDLFDFRVKSVTRDNLCRHRAKEMLSEAISHEKCYATIELSKIEIAILQDKSIPMWADRIGIVLDQMRESGQESESAKIQKQLLGY